MGGGGQLPRVTSVLQQEQLEHQPPPEVEVEKAHLVLDDAALSELDGAPAGPEEEPIEDSKRELEGLEARIVSAPRLILFLIASVLTLGMLPLVLSIKRFRWLLAYGTCRMCARHEMPAAMLVREPGTNKWFICRVHTRQFAQRRERSIVRKESGSEDGNEGTLGALYAAASSTKRLADPGRIVFFDFRCRRYVQCADGSFARCQMRMGLSASGLAARYGQGLEALEARRRAALYGVNELRPSFKALPLRLLIEGSHPYFLFQYVAAAIWIYEEMYLFGSLVLFMSVVTFSWTAWLRWRSASRLDAKLSQVSTKIVVRRRGREEGAGAEVREEVIATDRLVPGDAVVIRSHRSAAARRASVAAGEADAGRTTAMPFSLPADMLLLRGECLVDESSLRGQPLPMTKQGLLWGGGHAGSDPVDFDKAEHSTLFCGTTLLQVLSSEPLLCIVIRTGYATQRGPFFHEVLYAGEGRHAVIRRLRPYFVVQSIISVVAFILALGMLFLDTGPNTPFTLREIFVSCFDFVTLSIPASLLFIISLAFVLGKMRLRRSGVVVLDPNRLLTTGMSTAVCFDKTGVLTSERITFFGVQPCTNATMRQVVQSFQTEENSGAIERCLALCHTLSAGQSEGAGRPIDVQGFRATGWALVEPERELRERRGVLSLVKPPTEVGIASGNDEEWAVLRRFDFDLRRMCSSVVVAGISSNRLAVYCKGSPHAVAKICLPHTVPRNYVKALRVHGEAGRTMLACAHKPMPFMSPQEVRAMSRDEAESGLIFDGLFLLNNPIRREVPDVVASMRSSNFRICVLTGDSLHTAIAVLRNCGIVEQRARVLVVDARAGDLICYDAVDETRLLSVQAELLRDAPAADSDDEDELGRRHGPGAGVGSTAWAVTGDGVEALFEAIDRPGGFTEGAEAADPHREAREAVVRRAVLFARLRPENKTDVVRALEHAGNTTLMVGDGVNDLGGMQESSAGLSFGSTCLETRVVAEYVAAKAHAHATVALLLEARCCLCTVYEILTFLMFSSILQIGQNLRLLATGGFDFSSEQYCFRAAGIMMPIAMAMCLQRPRTGPGALSRKLPHFSIVLIVLSGAGHLAIALGLEAFLYARALAAPWYCSPYVANVNGCYALETKRDAVSCIENTISWTMANIINVGVAWALSFNAKNSAFREAAHRNRLYLLMTFAAFACGVFFLIGNPDNFAGVRFSFSLVPLPWDFVITIGVGCAVAIAGSITYEKFVVAVATRPVVALANSLERAARKTWRRVRRGRAGRRAGRGEGGVDEGAFIVEEPSPSHRPRHPAQESAEANAMAGIAPPPLGLPPPASHGSTPSVFSGPRSRPASEAAAPAADGPEALAARAAAAAEAKGPRQAGRALSLRRAPSRKWKEALAGLPPLSAAAPPPAAELAADDAPAAGPTPPRAESPEAGEAPPREGPRRSGASWPVLRQPSGRFGRGGRAPSKWPSGRVPSGPVPLIDYKRSILLRPPAIEVPPPPDGGVEEVSVVVD